jgi:hypothetical protein
MKPFIIIALGIACLAVGLLYIVPPLRINVQEEKTLSTPPTSPPLSRPPLSGGTHLMFRHTASGPGYGKLSVVPVDARDGPYTTTALQCDRLHFAADHGVCLTAQRGLFTTYEAIMFDRQFQPRQKYSLAGIPSRTRVSPDGHVVAITVFVSGHSYAAHHFSTLTVFLDLQSGEPLVPDMEQFTVRKQGQLVRAVDLNFWGITFAQDSNRFYATLGTGGQTYLIEGNLANREAQILRENIECPSLSPDNTRIVFKRRMNSVWGPVTWRLFMLDLTTFSEQPLAEVRSVDDQVEWLDDHQVLYALSERTLGRVETTAWVVPVDGSGEPRRFLSDAYSPVVVRDTPGDPHRASTTGGQR